MADITDQHDQTSPQDIDDANSVGNGTAAAESRGVKRQRPTPADDDDDDDEKGGRERRKIEIKFISDKSRRHITFSKRKAGIMKKVRQASTPSLPHPPRHLVFHDRDEDLLSRFCFLRHPSSPSSHPLPCRLAAALVLSSPAD